MPTSLDSIKPGQSIRCTVTAAPRNEAAADTIQRLMFMDPSVKKGLRRAQVRRRQDMVVYNRGNRDWYKREKCARIANPSLGATWTMSYSPLLARDIASVQSILNIEQA